MQLFTYLFRYKTDC